MKIFSKGPFAAIFWGGLLAGVLDLTQAFIGFSLMGSTPFRILQRIAGGIFGNAFSRYGMGLCGHWPCLSFHCRVRGGGRLLHCQQKTSSVSRTPNAVRSLLRRISIPVHVLRGYSAFGDRSSAV